MSKRGSPRLHVCPVNQPGYLPLIDDYIERMVVQMQQSVPALGNSIERLQQDIGVGVEAWPTHHCR